jgi:hypothetical protein
MGRTSSGEKGKNLTRRLASARQDHRPDGIIKTGNMGMVEADYIHSFILLQANSFPYPV